MRRILMSLLIIGAVASMIGGATLAYFSDTASSTNNTFSAGTLDLGLGNTSGSGSTGDVSGTFTASAWAPGDEKESTLYVRNAGTIDATHTTVAFDYSLSGAVPTGVSDPKNTTLDNEIIAKTVKWSGVEIPALENKTLSDLKTTYTTTSPYDFGALTAGTEAPLYIDWEFSSAADNGCQGKTATVTLNMGITQAP